MLVNSVQFWVFFVTLFIPYWIASYSKNGKVQNWLLLIASYYFYAQTSWKMCILLAVATIVFYFLGRAIETQKKYSTKLAAFGVCLGVGLLVYFKFLDFFIDEFASLLNNIGLKTNMSSFGIIVPLGISFFTFKLISYVIEVNRENIPATHDIVGFAVYVAYFPTIMSGPIDRPGEFLDQLKEKRTPMYDNLADGARRIIWGMFLKMCIADRISGYTDAVFGNYANHNGTSILIAMFFYAFQMYTDFCGYTEMAIGTSQLLGIKIRENFKRPFFAQNVAEYWRRWHMSLTTWLTDYVFMPLNVAFRNMGQWGLFLATLINLIVVGFWHGANWTYGLFGLYHGLLLVIVTANEKRRKKFEKKHNLKNNALWKYSRIILTFCLCTIGFLIFRSNSINDFFGAFNQLFKGFGMPYFDLTVCSLSVFFITILVFKELKDENGWNIHLLHSKKSWVRILTFSLLILTILLTGELDGGSFIYFQF